MSLDAPSDSPARSGWQAFSRAALNGFHTYANWLVSISWRRFIVLSVLLMVVAAIVEELPPFRWRETEQVQIVPAPPKPPRAPAVSKKPRGTASHPEGVDISIDDRGVHITTRPAAAASAASAASAAAPADDVADSLTVPGVSIKLPPGASAEEIKQAIQEAKSDIADAMRDAADTAREAAQEGAPRVRVRTVRAGDFITNLAVLWILASVIIKITYKGRLQAEVKAARATEAAEAESLKRQVVEARMAAMQAQVEPHFLFNTLASIDHLIETDPPRASKMQKNLIALLRASMPTMREASVGGLRDLGRELAVIKPYLEILKVRMEERLQTSIDVPEGLHSAEFPPMMIQSLVENAIKHGLEPKADGGQLSVRAEIVHGKLVVTVSDTGLGFGKAATAGTGVGLANIRERLQLLYGHRATLTVAANQPSGTVVAITVPYTARMGQAGSV